MNNNTPLSFEQKGTELTIVLDKVNADPVDTIIKIELNSPLPPAPAKTSQEGSLSGKPKPGNLASQKPAKLLSLDGSHELTPCVNSRFASLGVDNNTLTLAQASGEWSWTFQVDLETISKVSRIVVIFDKKGYATEYKVLVSTDGKNWNGVAEVSNNHKAGIYAHTFSAMPARYNRVQGIKPDGPNQEGTHMIIAELEVYEK